MHSLPFLLTMYANLGEKAKLFAYFLDLGAETEPRTELGICPFMVYNE